MSELSAVIQQKLDNLQASVDTLQAGFASIKEQLSAAANGLTAEEAQAIVTKIDEITADVQSTEGVSETPPPAEPIAGEAEAPAAE